MWVSGSLISSKHLAVEFGVRAVHLQIDFFAEFVRQIAHDARQLRPRIADRLHARLHHAFLQFGGNIRQPLQRRLEFAVVVVANHLQQLVARQHQFADHHDQIFDHIDVDADRLVGKRRLSAFAAAGARMPSAAIAPLPLAPALAAATWSATASTDLRRFASTDRLRPPAAEISAPPPNIAFRRRCRIAPAAIKSCRRLAVRFRSVRSSVRITLMRSSDSKISVTASGVTSTSPSRNFPSTFSEWCATFSSRGRPMKPQCP